MDDPQDPEGFIHPGLMFPELERTSRAARAAGAKLFFTGMPCRHPSARHLAPRRVSDAKCVACVAALKRKKAGAEAALREQTKAKRDAPKTVAREAKVRAAEEAAEARKAARRAEREARRKSRIAARAAATRAANKAAKGDAARAVAAVPNPPMDQDDGRAPWDDDT